MKTLYKVAAPWSLILLIPLSAAAWGSVEHKVIARIAWENMTPQTRAAVIELLHRAPADSNLEEYFPVDIQDRSVQERDFFVNVSVWADSVRASQLREKYSCPLWHFAEFLYVVNGMTIPDTPAFTQRQVNIVERLKFFQLALIDESEPVSNRAIELAWTIHLIGDIHAPLHITSRVTDEEPEGDRGGNMFKLAQGNLHSYWDRIISKEVPRKEEDEPEADYILRVANLIMSSHPRRSIGYELHPGRAEAWALESFQIAKTEIYSNIERNQEPSREYQHRAFQIAQRRIALAGYRLAQTLNDLFTAQKAKPEADSTTAEVREIKVRLDYDLACVAATLEDKIKNLKIIEGTVTEGAQRGQDAAGVDVDKVGEILVETKNDLLDTLSGEDLAGMRAYVEKHFPTEARLPTLTIRLEAVGRTSPPGYDRHAPLLVTAIRWANFDTKSIARTESVNGVVDRAKAFIWSLRRSGGPITLTVMTTPVQEANITLQAPGGKQYTTRTNSGISGFWPGTYTIRVTKDGFVTIVHPNVDLGFNNTIVDCHLVTSGSQIFCQTR